MRAKKNPFETIKIDRTGCVACPTLSDTGRLDSLHAELPKGPQSNQLDINEKLRARRHSHTSVLIGWIRSD
ncbi:hypothetical protein LPU83_pLPU83b_0538 (plasmid) [Rhizobium favelukesii]|uniref:Uncharacterized protein n=1 Tax=Rhizobium favelukesii TaxID=348824 RepID=W6RI55_9HYPH|nr:hypothetical protein LPU83_pLPU83b_0538 [Rhizobium favelukesii]